MKYLVLVVVVLLVLWLAKSSRGKVGPTAGKPGKPGASGGPPAAPALADGEMMPACAHCGLHLPRSEALPGRGGVFCSEAHRAIAEARDGPA